MKVYRGKRVFSPATMTRGEAFVSVENALDDRAPERRPLKHIPYHSPDGFEWGYLGSGPADLGLAILADYFGEPPELALAAQRSTWAPRSKAASLHQLFKQQFLAPEQRDEWEIDSDAIGEWLESPSIRSRLCELAREEAELAEIRRLEEEARRADAAAD
jgi:Family of unknown function (DUF6166)